MSMLRKVVVAIVILVVLTYMCRADDGWHMPNLNPFSGKGSGSNRANPPTSGWHAPTSNSWHMPKLWPSTTANNKKPQTSTLYKMTNGTQKMLNKTADALTPWDNKKPSPPPKITGSNSIFTHQGQQKKEQKSSGILPASWWTTESKPKQPDSVNAFLSQPRPH
jgi:hypothetical protein